MVWIEPKSSRHPWMLVENGVVQVKVRQTDDGTWEADPPVSIVCHDGACAPAEYLTPQEAMWAVDSDLYHRRALNALHCAEKAVERAVERARQDALLHAWCVQVTYS